MHITTPKQAVSIKDLVFLVLLVGLT